MDKYEPLIKHLSDEIRIRFQNAMVFRTRITFLTWIGPILILGSAVVATRGNFDIPNTMTVWVCVAIVSTCYLVLGYVGGHIEAREWYKCHKYRRSIYNIVKEGNLDGVDEIVFLVEKPKYITWGYTLIYLIVLISTIAITVLAINIETLDKQLQSDKTLKHDGGPNSRHTAPRTIE